MAKQLLDPHLWNLETLFKCVYNIPVYQRPYSWDKEQVDVLLEDIFANYESESQTDGYYTGNIIIYDKDSKIDGHITSYDIIDGQQRITTFSLILLATYSLAIINGAKETDTSVLKIKEALWKIVNRTNQKELRAVSLNSIEKECYDAVYDQCFDDPKNIFEYCNNYECKNVFDERIVSNFSEIYKLLNERIVSKSSDEILNLADYLLIYIQFITIEANCKQQEVFTMFESINSKGKKLEVIDLIKTYIFSKMDEESYNKYSKKWGALINKTNDNLYDYLYTYIRAYVTYYRQNINIENFKSISKRELILKYNADSEKEALMKLIDDMTEKVDYYNMLENTESAYELIKSSKLRFFYNVFVNNGYQHPKPLFFRTLLEFKNENISKKDAEDIVLETVSFMLKFLTISDRDSKDAISVFKDIMTDIIKEDRIDKQMIINRLESQLMLKGITSDTLKNTIKLLDCYSEKRDMSIPLIALYECTEKKEDENGEEKYITSYDQAYELVKDFSKLYSLDHLLVQTPEIDDPHFKYYKDKNNNTLVLKEGHDFPEELAQEGMNYDSFAKTVLNRIGNLRIYYRDKNSGRQNDAISLPENENFYDYSNIKTRANDMANIIFDICIPNYQIDIKNIDFGKEEKIVKKFLDMNDFFEMGELSSGDQVYITLKPGNSIATLVDSKYVIYNGEKITINEWGCRVTGWKSIRIYEYMAKVGETETLQDKRIRIEKDNVSEQN
jgi:uncharacterized protein with ParB-like and HNH nuclease domain